MKKTIKELYYEYKNKKGESIKIKLPEGDYFELDRQTLEAGGPNVAKYIENLFDTKKYTKWQLYKFASGIANQPEAIGIDWFNTFYYLEKYIYLEKSELIKKQGIENYFSTELVNLQCKMFNIKIN